MKQEPTKTTLKDRIVVLEKGKDMEIGPLAVCCAIVITPFRG